MARPTRAELNERYRERLAEVRAENEARRLREAMAAQATDAPDIPRGTAALGDHGPQGRGFPGPGDPRASRP